MGLRAYRGRVDGVTDPICDLCGQAPQTLEHWLQDCPATAVRRHQLFGTESGNLGCLTSHPQEALALARCTLRLGERSKNTNKSTPA